ncbi:MAG: dihydrodipicolinate synthase family protein [Kiritimatiellia bacterium]
MKEFTLEGLVAAPVTPMRADGAVDCSLIAPCSDLLKQNSVTGAFVCGTTGESLSLTVPERKMIAEEWKNNTGNNLKLIVHVGHDSVEDARILTSHAQDIGADAVACMAPCFFKPSCIADLTDFCAQVASAAPQLPFYFYHIPSITGVNMPVIDFLRCAADRIPNLAGVKYTFENLMDFDQCVRFDGGRYNMLFGRDEMLLPGLATGAKGAVGTTFNFAAPVYHRIIRDFKDGDMAAARIAQSEANDMIEILIKYGGNPAVAKAFMKYIGIECGGVRSPLQSLTEEQYVQLSADLDKINFKANASVLP